YITSAQSCGNTGTGNLGDPEVIYLSPVEQNISKVIWNATNNFAITTHYYSVIIPKGGTAISSFRIDGTPVSPIFFAQHPADPDYVYLTRTVGSGQRRIESDSGFNAIAYGYGANESYGYNAGTNVKDLYQQVGVFSQYGIEQIPSVCTGSPFKFKVSLPYLADSMRWNLSGLPGSPANVLMTYSNPPVPSDADSTTIVNGKTIYWYSLPNFYTFNTVGTFPVVITAYAATAEGCGNEQEISFDLEVNNPPVGDFNWTHNGCVDQVVQFNDQTVSVKPTYRWWWNFGDPASGAANSSNLRNPTHNFSGPGTYTVRYSNITTPGCLSDTIVKQIVINPLPVGTVSGDIIVCHNAPSPNVVFTGTVGTAPFTFTYNINNGPAQTITTTTGNSISLPVPTATIGSFSYHLVSVRDAAGTAGCFQAMPDTVTVLVNPLPTATISGGTTVCRNAAAPLVSFTASGGSVAPFSFDYTINGGPVQTITTITGNTVTVPVPTGTVGTFIYQLQSVRDASATACSQLQSGSVSVIVNPLPTATVSGTTAVCINGTAPLVTFTGAGTTAPYTFTYTINGGAPQTVVSSGNTATLTAPTGTAGSFVYSLVSVRDGSSTNCSQLQTGSATITVHPLPTAAFSFSAPGCATRVISFSDNSVANAGSVNSWSWDFGDPGSGAANTSSLQNPTHIFSSPGSYTVSLTVANSEGCIAAAVQRTVLIASLPTAAFSLPEVCLLDPSAQFTDNSTAISPATISGWQWNFGDPGSGPNNTSTAQNGQHAYTAVGNYNVRLVVTTNSGCTDTLTRILTVNGGNPVANFIQLNPAGSCSSDSVAIQNKSTIASGVITKVAIHWDNTNQPTVFETDDDPVFDRIYKHKYPTSTNTINYNVRFRAYSGGVCVNDRIIPVTVLATPDVALANIPDQCYTSSPLLLNFGTESGGVAGTGSYSGPGVSFSAGNWLFNSTVAGIGTHTIKYKFTATAGSCADSTETIVRVLDTASARFTVAAPACEKNTISFNDLSTSPTSVSLASTVWDFGDGTPPVTFPIGSPVTHTFASAGTYPVSMYNVSTTNCRSAGVTQQVIVNPIPVPAFSFPPSLCLPGANAVFTNTSSIADGTENAFSYLWNFGDPASGGANSSTVKDPSHVYNAVGPYNVKLQVTSGAGCVDDTSIVLNTIHPQPKADFSQSRTAICIGDNVGFTTLSNGGDGSIVSYSWTFGNGLAVAAANPTQVFNSAGTVNVQHFITNSFGCNSDTASKPVKVYALPTVNAGPDLFVLEGGTATLQPGFTGDDNSYLWTPSDYLNSTTLAQPVTKPLMDITYRITVTNPGGCSAFDEVFVKLLKGPNIPNTFSPNGDGINDKWIIEYLDTYPNCRVLVFTRAGQKVFESRGYKTPWNGTMNGKSLPLDTYYYIIEPENGRKPVTGYITIIK
ncbi:MAG: PKD domain-containing protein, partial [Chitinophagaceae bacterium]